MKTISVLLIGLLSLSVASPGRASAVPEMPRVTLGAEGMTLRRWFLLGPFTGKPGEAAIDVDFLAPLGRPEAGCGSDDLRQWAERLTTGKPPAGPAARIADGADIVDFSQQFDVPLPIAWGSPQPTVYAACEIVAESAHEAYLLFGSDDGAIVWLNGQQCHLVRDGRALTPGEDAIRLPLQPGVNSLLVKVVNYAGTWKMSARLEPSANAAAAFLFEQRGALLQQAVVPDEGGLALDVRGVPRAAVIAAKVESWSGAEVGSWQWEAAPPPSLATLPHGLYQVTLCIDGRAFRQVFYRGSMAGLRDEMTARCQSITPGEDRIAINLATLARRLEILNRPYVPDPAGESPWTQRMFEQAGGYKAVYAATELLKAMDRLAAGEEPFRHRPGLHLRGFRSRIDDQVLHYRLFVPSNYRADGTGLPLVIVAPTVFTRPAPYLESIYVAQHEEAERWARVAEASGVGVLWPGYRVSPYGNPIDFTQLDEALATVAADYQLDPARLYLHGACSGGIIAAMEATRHPGRYAAVTLVNPVLHRMKGRYDENPDFVAEPGYQAWLRATDPLRAFATLRDLPVWIIHDGVDPDHGPLAHSVDLVEESRAVGNRPRFDRDRARQWEQFSIAEEHFRWMAQQRRKEVQPLDFLADATAGGPLARALAERFIVVEATGGSEAEHAANQKLSVAFQEAWRRTNYVSCRVVADTDLPADEERRSNLVLLGNARTNAAWARFAGNLPVMLTDGSVTVAGRTWEGESLALQAWFPTPGVAGKKLVLVGAAQPAKAIFGTLELALDGWFDYAVWDNAGDQPRLIAAGRDPAASPIQRPGMTIK